MRLLVVEDDIKMAALLKRGLEREGYATDVVSRGEDALWATREVAYDGLVLDGMIPDVDGFEVCRQMRQEAGGCPCSCSPPGTPWRTGCGASTPGRTTT